MWVSLVKEASDTGGIPSPLALLSGLWLPNLSPKTTEVLGDERGDIWLEELDQQRAGRSARGHGRCLTWSYRLRSYQSTVPKHFNSLVTHLECSHSASS